MRALGAQHEAVQPTRLPNRVKPVQPPGQDLVNVGLVADVEKQLVVRSRKDGVQGQSQLDDAQVGSQMAAGFRERLNEEFANLPGQRCNFCGRSPSTVD